MKTLICIIIAIALFVLIVFGIVMLLGRIYIKKNNTECYVAEQITKSLGESDKNVLILYQPSKHLSTNKALKCITNSLTKLNYNVVSNCPSSRINYNIAEYDKLVLMSSVYMGTMAQTIYNFIANKNFMGREVIIIAIGMIPEEQKEIENLEKAIPEGNLIKKVKVSPDKLEYLDEWIHENI